MDEIVDAGDVVGDEVDTPETVREVLVIHFYSHTLLIPNIPSVRVRGGETHEAVGELVLVNESAELAAEVRSITHGAVPVTDNSLSDKSSEVVVVLPAHTLDSNGDVGGGDGVVTDSDLGTNKVGLLLLSGGNGLGGRGRRLHGHVGEVLLGELDKLVVGNSSRSDKNHTVGSVVGLDVVGQIIAGDALDVLLGTEDGATERLVHEGSGVKVVEDDFLELLVNLLLLSEDNITLALNGRRLELGVLKNVGKNVNSVGHVRVERLGVVDGVFAL